MFINSKVTDFLIIKPFNTMFFILLALFLLLCFFLIRTFKNKSDKSKRTLIAFFYLSTLVLLILYKIILLQDAEYFQIRESAGLPVSNFWDELPFNLCNINTILIVLAALLNNRTLYSFSFFFGSLGALFALLMPVVGFSGYSVLLPRIIGYYATHLLLFIQMPLLAGLNIFKPDYKDIIPTYVLLLVLAAVITGLNFLLRSLGMTPTCNYFYAMNPAGNPILEMFYGWIPIPGVYLLPCSIIVLPCMVLITAIFRLFSKNR